MIYTPLRRIPIGEAVQRADGTYALRIKKPNKDEFDEISMDHLVAAVIREPPQSRRPLHTTDAQCEQGRYTEPSRHEHCRFIAR